MPEALPSNRTREAVRANPEVSFRQKTLNGQGFSMAAALSRGVPDMLRGGVVVDGTTESDRARGRVRYTTPQNEYVGGWRPFSYNGTTKLIRVTLCQPDGTRNSIEGFAEVEVANVKQIGATKLPGNPEFVRVDIDEAGTPHVSGKANGVKFNVDHPNPAHPEADFNSAENLFGAASVGLRAIAESMPPVQPVHPQQPGLPSLPTL